MNRKLPACCIVVALTMLLTLVPSGRAQSVTRFRLAIIGLVHSHGWGHLRNIAKMPNVDLVGIADVNAELREDAAQIAPGVAMYDDYRKLLEEKKPEGVWAFVENDRHLEVTRLCAERGVHVIFEKPMAATYKDAQEMLALARKHNIKLMVNYQMAWWPENYTAHDLAKSGELGKIWRVRSIIGHNGPAPKNPPDNRRGKYFWAWLNDEKRGGGALVDFVGYGAVWCRWYLGMPKTVYAITTHTRPETYKTNTNATVLATFEGNGVGLIEGSWDLPRGFQDVEVFGDKGSVYMARNKIESFLSSERKEVPIGTLNEDRREPVSYFIGRVRTNQPLDGMVSPEFNLDVMQITEAAERSAKSGKPVSLPLR